MGRGADEIKWPLHFEVTIQIMNSFALYSVYIFPIVIALVHEFAWFNRECHVLLQVSRVTVRAKEVVEAMGGSVRRVHYNKLGLKALLKPEWFEKKGRLLPRAARPPPKQQDRVDSIGRLPAPRKPIPFFAAEENKVETLVESWSLVCLNVWCFGFSCLCCFLVMLLHENWECRFFLFDK